MPQPPRRRPAPLREREFHAWLARHLPSGRSGLLPLGDDAAAFRPPPGRVAVLTTDALVEGTHFLPDSPPDRVGRAAAAVSLSDAAAKGAKPAGLLLALLLPRGSPAAWAQEVALGADRMGRMYGAPLAGGDTKPAPRRAIVSTVLGLAPPGSLAPRTAARAGDLLVTTGTVGRGGAAAYGWKGDGAAPAGRRAALRTLLDVRPRVREGAALGRWAHAMLDTSDGIAEATRLLARASRLRVVVDRAKLPFDPGLRRLPPAARWKAAIYGGDYELLATLAPEDRTAAFRAVRATGGSLTEIGRVEPGAGAWAVSEDRTRRMPPGGWGPFDRPTGGPG